ncbi:hypothetical protein NMY22_g2162 [Coprinellus aureogranulatus]|nr:hypothetical protein NMY22_g2162 [Coprinellus aureogranulatus]
MSNYPPTMLPARQLNFGRSNASSHLLGFPLFSLTDEMAERIGPVYLKRLFFLHFGRSDALKRVLLPPPQPHPPTHNCDFNEQKKLTRAWALASAYLAWEARPDLSTSTMESALRPLADHLTCEQCQAALRERIKNLVVQWSVVKVCRIFVFGSIRKLTTHVHSTAYDLMRKQIRTFGNAPDHSALLALHPHRLANVVLGPLSCPPF